MTAVVVVVVAGCVAAYAVALARLAYWRRRLRLTLARRAVAEAEGIVLDEAIKIARGD